MTIRPRRADPPRTLRAAPEARRRRAVQAAAVALTALTAAIYFVIGANLVTVIDAPAEQRIFGLIAGSGYLLAALLLLASERRWIYLSGVLLQLFVIVQYVNLASERTPSYEAWGLALRAPQLLLLAALAWLAWRWPSSTARPPSPRKEPPA